MIIMTNLFKRTRTLYLLYTVFSFLLQRLNAQLHELSFNCKICLIAVPSQRSIQSRLIKLHMKINKEVRLTTDK